MNEETKLRERETDAWHRELNDGRTQIMCKAPGYRIKVTAPNQEAWEAVELFEKWTGCMVSSDRRPPRKLSVPEGQLPLVSMTELESEGNDG